MQKIDETRLALPFGGSKWFGSPLTKSRNTCTLTGRVKNPPATATGRLELKMQMRDDLVRLDSEAINLLPGFPMGKKKEG